MCVGEKVVARLDAGIEHHVRQKRSVRSQAHVGTDNRVCADVRFRADHRRGVDDGRGMDAGRVHWRLIEKAERARKGMIGILDAQRGGRDLLEFRLDDDRRGTRGAGQCRVARIRDEGDLGGAGFFDALDAGDFQVGIAAQFGAQTACQLA